MRWFKVENRYGSWGGGGMILYCEGRFLEAAEAAVEDAAHVAHGLGFYEDLLYNGHMLRHLDAHLRRLFRSLDAFGIDYAKAPVEEVVDDLLEFNLLTGAFAMVTVAYAVRHVRAKALPSIQVRPWSPPGPEPVRLVVYPRLHQSHLCAHRTLDGMHQCLALAYAAERQADDAVLLDAGGNVLEAAGAGLVFSDGKNFVAPKSEFRLERIAQSRAEGVLHLREKSLPLSEALAYPHAYILGSLFGMRPVASIGEAAFEPDTAACELANLKIL